MNNQSNQSTPVATLANDITTDHDQPFSDELKVSLGVIIMFCSIVANFLLIAIVCSNPHMRTSFNYLIVNMSVSDLFAPILAIPMLLTYDLNAGRWLVDGRFGEVLCKVCYYLVDLTPSVSVFSLVIIAANRFVAIVFPMHVNVFNKKITARILIIAPWVVSMAIVSHSFYTMRIVRDHSGYPYCTFSWEPAFEHIPSLRVNVMLYLVLFFLIPFLVIAVMYSIMMYKIHQSSKNVSSMIQDNRSRKYRDRQIFYLSVLIIVAFGVLYGPVYIYHANRAMTLKGNPTIDFACYILTWSNTVVNPLICILFNGNFRQGFRRLCCRFYWRSKRMTIQSQPTRTTKQNKDNDSFFKSASVDRFQVITAL